jgi:hypothetical protein
MERTSPKRYPKQRKKRPKKLRIPVYGFAGLVFFILLFLGLKTFGNVTSPKAPILVKGSPSLVVDQKVVDLGTIQLGKTVTYQFNLTNVGDKPLKLSKEAYTELVKGC